MDNLGRQDFLSTLHNKVIFITLNFQTQQKLINLESMENTKNLVRVCPICNEKNGIKLHTQKFSLPKNSVLPSDYDVVACKNCGFCFADSRATQKEYDLYYNQMSKYEDKETASGGGLNSIDKARLSLAAEIISENQENKGASILDIGCANGGLLQCLDEKGYKNLTGIDITRICVENVKKLGYKAYFGGVFNLEELSDKKYDVVILSHVLEHLFDLQQTAKNLKNLLNPNGIIYIEVPDASQYANHFVVPFYYFDCEHINHFDINSLNNLFVDGSLECIAYNAREVKASETTMYPVVSAVFKNAGHSKTDSSVVKSESVLDSIRKYIELSDQKSDFSEIENLITLHTPVLVWGAGMYTLRLLENSPLKKCNILCFLDKDFKKQGSSIENIMIKNPLEVLKQDKTSTIIIASAIHGQAIKNEIVSIDQHTNRKTIIL